MNRIIKFRVWDKEVKEMFIPSYPDEVQFDNGTPYWADCEDFVAMQFTGLKDKNGKDIYEGDIVKIENRILEVFWNERFCGFELMATGNSLGWYAGKDEIEVVGNKFENPELLNYALCENLIGRKDDK